MAGASLMVAVGDFNTAESFPDSVPGGPPPPLKNGNRRGYLQVSLRQERQCRRLAWRDSSQAKGGARRSLPRIYATAPSRDQLGGADYPQSQERRDPAASIIATAGSEAAQAYADD